MRHRAQITCDGAFMANHLPLKLPHPRSRFPLSSCPSPPSSSTSSALQSPEESDGVMQQPQIVPTTLRSARCRNNDLRVRQHVNPLAAYFQQPVALEEDWYVRAFECPEKPLVIDVGVARGRWIKKMSEKHPETNFLGLEIRAGLVAAANAVRDRDGLRNLHYIYCNANVSFSDIVASTAGEKRDISLGNVELVCFQFCDPWFKSRHAKRRLVQEPLVKQVYDALQPRKGRCYVVSDVYKLAIEMRDRFDACVGMERDDQLQWTEDGWLCENPFGVPSEREVSVRNSAKGNIYRAMFRVKYDESQFSNG